MSGIFNTNAYFVYIRTALVARKKKEKKRTALSILMHSRGSCIVTKHNNIVHDPCLKNKKIYCTAWTWQTHFESPIGPLQAKKDPGPQSSCAS